MTSNRARTGAPCLQASGIHENARAAELLKVEGWLFLQRADKYAGQSHSAAFPFFAAEVERQIAKEVGEYVANFDMEAATARVSQMTRMMEAAGARPPEPKPPKSAPPSPPSESGGGAGGGSPAA